MTHNTPYLRIKIFGLDTRDALRFIKYPSFSQDYSSLFYKELYKSEKFQYEVNMFI